MTANCGGWGFTHTPWQKLTATFEVAMEGNFQGANSGRARPRPTERNTSKEGVLVV